VVFPRPRGAALTAAIALALSTLALAAPPAPTPDVDPDLPGFAQTPEAKEAFLRARDEHVALLRGVPHFLPYEPRTKALRELEEQLRRSPEIDPAFWTPLGPAPIPNGQTQSVSTAVSGRSVAIAIHPANPDVVYVGTAQGGVYRSTNGGLNWTPLFDSAQSLAIGALALAPSNPEILYVGTGEPSGSADSFFGVGLYRIENASTTATLVGPFDPAVTTGVAGTTAFTGRAISEILVHPTDPATIFVSTFTGTSGNPSGGSVGFTVPPLGMLGLYRSTNATSASPSFTKLTVTAANSIPPDTSGNRSISDVVMDPNDPNVVVAWVLGAAAVGDGGLYRTTNALAATPSFTPLVAAATANARGELAAVHAAGVTTMYAAIGDSNGRVRKSTDGGATWSGYLSGGVNFCNPQCFYDIAVTTHPGDPNLVYLGGSPTLIAGRSTDGGATFTTNGVSAVGLHVDTHAIAVAPSNPSVVYFASDGGVWRSSDGGLTWASRNNSSFDATQFQSLAIHPFDRELMIGGTQDNGTELRRADGTWTRSDGGDGGYTLIDQSATDTTNVTMYHTYYNQTTAMGFARVTTVASANSGNWNPFFGCGFGGSTANGISCPASAILFYAPMALGPGNPNTVYFGSDRLYRSADLGATMPAVSQVLVAGQAITAIGVAPSNDNVRLAGTRNGRVFMTATGSATLTDVTSPSMPAPHPSDANQRRAIGRFAIHPTNPDVAYVAFGGYGVAGGQHVWRTSNLTTGAPTWVPSGTGIPDVPVNALVIDPAQPNNVYAGTDIGVYASSDAGATWTPYTTGMPRVAVFDLTLQHTGTHRVIRAATHGRGIWERTPLPVPVELTGFGIE